MKKITLLLAICFAFQFNASSQVLVPDTNFEQALLDFSIDTDGLLNGEISTVDAEAVTGTLSIINRSITDFTGLEGFINITGLDISYNNMSTLSVTANTLLALLNLEGCTSLTSFDITGLTTLVDVAIPGCPIPSLDLSANLGLTTLDVRLTGITMLDLSANTALVALECNNNNLTDLDMRNGNNANVTLFNSDFNGALECIFVDDSSAGYLTALPWSLDANSTFVNDEAACNTLTVEDVNQNVFNMYPNPVMNTVFVNANTQDSQLSIYDITGKVVLTKSLNLGENTVDVSQMASGVYLARFAAEGNVQTKKLIVQ